VCANSSTDEPGPAFQHGIQVHLAERPPAIGVLLARQHIEPFEDGLGLDPAMRLDDADDHVVAFALALLRHLEHRISLADARVRAQEDLQAAAALLLDRLEKDVGYRPILVLSQSAS
jgi:hypothetical protein